MECDPEILGATRGEEDETEPRPIEGRSALLPGSCLPGEVVIRPAREVRGVLNRTGREAESNVRFRRKGWFTTSTARSQGNTVTNRDTWTNSKEKKNPSKKGKNGS